MCASETIARSFFEICEFSRKYITLEYEWIMAGHNLHLTSNYETIFNNIDEDLLAGVALWVKAALPRSDGKEDSLKQSLINEDWASTIGEIYLGIKSGQSEFPKFIEDNENLLNEILRNAEMDTALTSILYQIERGIMPLNDHDMHIIKLRHQISIMGLGREPRVPTLSNYCDLIGLIANHNQTKRLKHLLLNALNSDEKLAVLNWAIQTEILSYIDEYYSGEEFIALEP